MARATSPAEPGTIERLAEWVLAVRAEHIADRTALQAKLLLLDTIGCGIAARDDECARAVLATVDALGGPPQCTIIGDARKTSMPNAVLANGTLIRVLDLNDFYVSPSGDLGGHPSDNIPVALAAAEAHESAGRELIAAIVIGYEIFARCLEPLEEDFLGSLDHLRSRRTRHGGPAHGPRPPPSRKRAGARRRARRDADGGPVRQYFSDQIDCERAGRAKRRASRNARRGERHRAA